MKRVDATDFQFDPEIFERSQVILDQLIRGLEPVYVESLRSNYEAVMDDQIELAPSYFWSSLGAMEDELDPLAVDPEGTVSYTESFHPVEDFNPVEAEDWEEILEQTTKLKVTLDDKEDLKRHYRKHFEKPDKLHSGGFSIGGMETYSTGFTVEREFGWREGDKSGEVHFRVGFPVVQVTGEMEVLAENSAENYLKEIVERIHPDLEPR